MFIEELVGMADIGFGLLHGRHVQKHERLPEMILAPKAPIALGEPLTIAPGLRSQTLPSIRPGADIQCILENGRH